MNKNLLRGKMAERQITQSQLAYEMGMSKNSLNRKIQGKGEFRLAEVIGICEILRIKDPADIFFANEIPNAQRRGKIREG